MFLDALIERSQRSTAPARYKSARVSHVLRIGADGAFLGFEELKLPREEVVPSVEGARTSGVYANTGVDNFTYMLGTGDSNKKVEWLQKRHNAYLSALAETDHAGARAIEKFLVHPSRPVILPVEKGTPESDEAEILNHAKAFHPRGENASVIRTVAPPSATVLVEVEGHPNWWRSPAVVSAHAARIARTNSQAGEDMSCCSLCGARKPAVRTFAQSKRMGVSLVSFNTPTVPALSAYGREQGYNVPTCAECDAGIAAGLDHLLADKGTARFYAKDAYLLWWSDGAANEPGATPWVLFDIILNQETSDEARELALSQIQDGHFASVAVAMGRGVLRRHVPVVANVVRANLQRWISAGLGPVYGVAASLLPSGEVNRNGDRPHELFMETLYLTLVAGEILPPRTTLAFERQSRTDPNFSETPLGRRRATFLSWAGVMPTFNLGDIPVTTSILDEAPQEAEMSNVAKMWFNLGRCFARLDTLQKANGAKVTIRHTRYDAVMRRPVMIEDLLRCHAGRKSPNGKQVMDRAADKFAGQASGLHTSTLPSKVTERNHYHTGFHYQKALEQSAWNSPSDSAPADSLSSDSLQQEEGAK